MFSGISPASLMLVLLIVVLLFGTKKLKGLGSEAGSAFKGFRTAMADEEPNSTAQLDSESKSAN